MIKDFLLNYIYGVKMPHTHLEGDKGITYLQTLLHEIYVCLNSLWNYELFSAEGQSVAISNLLIAIIALFLGLKIAKYFSNLIYNKLLRIISLELSVTNLLGKILHYLFIIIVTVVVLDIAHLPLTIFTFIGSFLVISIGVGGQHVVNNFISGLVLMIENSIKVGDMIEVDNIVGRVISLDARSVNIKTQENKNVFVPHSVILQNKVINWTSSDNKIRASTKIDINFGEVDPLELKELLYKTISKNADILIFPKPQILLLELSKNIMTFEVNFWINLALVSRVEVISDLNFQICEALGEHEIHLAVEYRKATSKRKIKKE